MTKTDIFNTIVRNAVSVLPDLDPGAIRIEDSLRDLGANSVDRMEIIVNTMAALGVKVPMTHFAQAKNIQGLVDIFYEQILAKR